MAAVSTVSCVLQSVICLLIFATGLAIECFQCNSVEHPGCDDLTVNDTSSQYYKKCDGEYQGHEPFCRKVATQIAHVDDSARVYRTCGWVVRPNTTKMDYCRKADTDFIKKMHCQCFTSACNASERIMVSSASILIVATIIFSVIKELDII